MDKKARTKPARFTPKLQTFADLLANAQSDTKLDSWNGMKVYVVEPQTGNVLMNVGGEMVHDPASLSKMMMFYLTQQAISNGTLRVDEPITISSFAGNQDYAKVIAGRTYTADALIEAMMTASDNGATQALADHLGSNTLEQMNTQAKELGLQNTRFANTHGLPNKVESNTTTARDMATLIQRLYKDFPAGTERYMGQDSVTYYGWYKNAKGKVVEGIHTYPAHHWLNDTESALALPQGYRAVAKTGYTDAARHNIASMVTTPDGRQLVVVVLGSNWSHQDIAIEAGVPTVLLTEKLIKGNKVRDALAGDLVEEFLVKQQPANLAPTALEAVQQCRRLIDPYAQPIPVNAYPKPPTQLTQDEKALGLQLPDAVTAKLHELVQSKRGILLSQSQEMPCDSPRLIPPRYETPARTLIR